MTKKTCKYEGCKQPTEAGEGNFRGFVLKNVDLRGSVFKQKLDFSNAEFGGKSVFSGLGVQKAVFKMDVKFWRTAFKDKANFRNAKFNGKADFHWATFEGKANFSYAEFKSGGSFDFANIDQETFENASIQYVSFRDVCLNNVRFAGAKMEFAYLADAKWKTLPNRSFFTKTKDAMSVYNPQSIIREETEAQENLKN